MELKRPLVSDSEEEETSDGEGPSRSKKARISAPTNVVNRKWESPSELWRELFWIQLTSSGKTEKAELLRRTDWKDLPLETLDWTSWVTLDSDDWIGQGSYGDVFGGCWRNIPSHINPPRVVIKRMKAPPLQESAAKKRYKKFKREVTVWQNLHHPNIVPFYGVCKAARCMPAIMSGWMANGTANEYLKSNPQVSRDSIVIGIALGMEYLHGREPQIVHGDLKGDNVLVDEEGRARLADFGLSRMIVDQTLWNTSATTAPGTFRWKAPELMDPANPQNTASAQTDVYAFAMTSLELFTGKPPFYPEYSNDGMVLLAVVHGRKTPSRPATDALHDLLWKQWERCWNNDPSQRPSMSQLAGELQSTSVESFLDKRKTCLFDIVTLRWMISSQTAKNHVESLFKLIGRKLESSGEDSIALISQMQLLVRSAGGFRQFVALCLRHGDSTGEMHLDDELHYWLDHNDIQTMQVLLECGANANAIRSTDSSRRTLLHLASKLNQLDVVHLLLMHHGNIKAQDSDKLTPLHIASIERNYSVILTLLEHGADPNAEDMLGQTPWLLFAQYTYYNGSRDASKMEDTRSALTSFLAHGADVNLKDPYHGRTVLHVVLAWQDFISAKILLEQPHLDLSITDGMGATTWLAFIRIYAIGAIGDFYALEDRISEVLGIFLSRGVDANMQTRDDNGRSLLHIACMRGNLVFVRTLLQNNADCASKDKEGLTPWQYFVDFYCYLKDHRTEEEDLMELIALFLARGADISAKGKADMTALHAASLSFHLDIIRELLEHGADARAERNDGFTPWQAFLKMYFWLAIDSADEMEKTIQELIKVFVHHGADITVASGDLRCTILHAASRANHESVAQYVLSQLSADHVNATDYHGCSPLHRVGSKSLAKLLLTHGANINARDEFGNTPLHLVGLVSRPPNMTFHVRLLLQHGADIEATNAFGSTPLHQAVYFGAVEAVQALLESGANAEAKDDGGQTPIQVARDRDKEDITRMLLEYGARDTD